jgi:GNAT superfamily N-acetyltransferase
MTDFSIQPATPNDCGLILDFIKGIAEYEKLSHLVEATEEKIRTHLFGEKAVAACIIAYNNKEAVGFALYFHNYSTFVSKPGIYLEDLFVLPIHRGKGYGKKLLLHLVQTAYEKNCGRLEWSVLDWNKPAIEFYESLGAKPMQGWTVYRMDEGRIKELAQTNLSQNN